MQIHNKTPTSPSSIFIADNNDSSRHTLQSLLVSYCQNITLVADKQVSSEYLLHNKFDLILLDLENPSFNQLELIKVIKSSSSINQDSPVIAITPHSKTHHHKQLIIAGFDECLVKPILIAQLKETLDLWLASSQQACTADEACFNYLSALLQKTAGNTSLTSVIFNKLFTELPVQLQQIERALTINDLITAQEITHKIHGSVSFCGFTDIQLLAKNLEISLSETNSHLIKENFDLFKLKTNQFISQKEIILAQL